MSHGPRRRASIDGGAFSSRIELLDEDNPTGNSYQITAPVFDADNGYFASGFTVYRFDK